MSIHFCISEKGILKTLYSVQETDYGWSFFSHLVGQLEVSTEELEQILDAIDKRKKILDEDLMTLWARNEDSSRPHPDHILKLSRELSGQVEPLISVVRLLRFFSKNEIIFLQSENL